MSARRQPGERPDAVRLTLVPLASHVPAEVRLRRLLKAMLRAYGWRCVEVCGPAAWSDAPGPDGQTGQVDGERAAP